MPSYPLNGRDRKAGKKRRGMIAEFGHLGCHWCGLGFTRTIRPTMDHLIPKSKGGPDAKSNLVLACGHCNLWRGNGDFPQVPARLEGKKAERVALALVRRYGSAVLLTTRHEHRTRLLAAVAAERGIPPSAGHRAVRLTGAQATDVRETLAEGQ